ncbi:MAG: hypothetical protein ACLROI_04175 [Beduini sp.]|uniref:S26 family signal peptidase n=1 Tax=Beduini sp. TaxID=1922300 RepID=UPI0011C98CED
MKKIKKITSFFFPYVIVYFVVLFTALILMPKEVPNLLGYQFYTVLTDSMEPTIPTYSIVLTHILDEDVPIKPDTIITFHADRFGENIILTHYFKTTQVDEGETYYRTQAEIADTYDNYHTLRSDIIGEYVFHIPYIGKMFLFYQSKFGLLVLAEYGSIFLVYLTIKTRWKEKDSLNDEVHLFKKNRA